MLGAARKNGPKTNQRHTLQEVPEEVVIEPLPVDLVARAAKLEIRKSVNIPPGLRRRAIAARDHHRDGELFVAAD
jgi:hypothetical protein